MLVGVDLAGTEAVAFGEDRQARAILALGVVGAFLIDLEEAVEADHLTRGAHAVGHAVLAVGLDLGGGALDLGARGLARQRPLPDELVELGGVGIEIAGDGSGGLVKSVGRMASCASCAFLALVSYWRGEAGT